MLYGTMQFTRSLSPVRSLTWNDPVSKTIHFVVPEPKASCVRNLQIIFVVTILVQAQFPEANILKVLGRVEVPLGPVGRSEGGQAAERAQDHENGGGKEVRRILGASETKETHLEHIDEMLT